MQNWLVHLHVVIVPHEMQTQRKKHQFSVMIFY